MVTHLMKNDLDICLFLCVDVILQSDQHALITAFNVT